MKIKWWGHACSRSPHLTVHIITDPYPIWLSAITIKRTVTVSHDHFDHNAVIVGGEPGIKQLERQAEC